MSQAKPRRPHKSRLLAFLNRYGMRQDVLAAHLGISRGTFHSKAMRQFRHRFSAEERARIVRFINKIPKVCDSDLFSEDD